MMEANTSGMTIIWMRARNSWPGSASQLPAVVATSGSTQPTLGPISIPVASPKTMPISTLSHKRCRIRSLK